MWAVTDRSGGGGGAIGRLVSGLMAVAPTAVALAGRLQAVPVLTRGFAVALLVVVSLTACVACQNWRGSVLGTNAPEPLAKEPDVRVRVASGEPSVTLGLATWGRVTDEAGGEVASPRRAAKLEFRAVPGGMRLEDGGPVRTTAVRVVDTGGGSISLGGMKVGSEVLVRPVEGGLEVIATLPMEDYLAGVTSKELFASWPLGAYEAQSISARSYAMHQRTLARARKQPYDLESTTADQVFGGRSELSVAQQAAKNTRGEVLVEQGQVLRAYFHSTCGGRPASAVGAFGGGSGQRYNHRRALAESDRAWACGGDKAAPLYRWSRTRTLMDAEAQLRSWGKANRHAIGSIGTLRGIEAKVVNDVGRAETFTVTDSRSTKYALRAEDLRRALSRAEDGSTLPREQSLPSADFVAQVSRERVVIEGRGHGHGVGLCQYCAKGFADQGVSAREMLSEFYPGATVVRLY